MAQRKGPRKTPTVKPHPGDLRVVMAGFTLLWPSRFAPDRFRGGPGTIVDAAHPLEDPTAAKGWLKGQAHKLREAVPTSDAERFPHPVSHPTAIAEVKAWEEAQKEPEPKRPPVAEVVVSNAAAAPPADPDGIPDPDPVSSDD